MNELSQFLVDAILSEEKSPIKKTVVIYVGRFQPMHKGHAGTYKHLVKKFGKNSVYVGTSDVVQLPKSPFNFKEKVKIANSMFGIPKNKIFKVKNPYKPTEILKKFNEETTAFVTVVGEKDKGRLGMGPGRYFQQYKGEPTEGYRDRGYVYVAPSSGGGISGTETRNGLSVGSDEQKKEFFKKRAYGKFNATIFKMITDKLNEDIEVKKEWIFDSLNEISKIAGDGLDVDDGPNIVYPSAPLFNKISIERAAKIGFEVVSDILGGEKAIDKTDYRVYGDGPVGAVSYFPAGIIGDMSPNNQVDIYSKGAYSQWYKHATRTASLVGYEVVRGLGINQDDAKQSGDDAKGAKELEKEFEASLQENIVLPVKVGDTIMTGRFKNKKTVVKTIGKDEHGMPTINGRKVVTFRLMKEGFVVEVAGTEIDCPKCNHSWELESDDDEKYLCHNCGYDSQKQEYDFDAFETWQEKNGMLDERSKGKLRPADLLRRKAAMAGKRAAIARKRKRTMMRKKPLAKLKKIAYKKAYLQVYDEFMKDLFPGKKKSELSIQQAKVVHKNVLRKKKRVLKRARFKFLPALRAKEADKFDGKEAARVPRKKGQHRGSSSHSDLYTDENPKGTIKGLKFATVDDAKKSVSKIKGSGKTHAHKIQAAIAMEQRARVMGKTSAAAVYRKFINQMKKKTKNEIEEIGVGTGQSGIRMGYPGKSELAARMKKVAKYRGLTNSDKEYQYKQIKEVNDFFYMDFKKYVYKNRGKINKLFKGLSPEEKKEYLERLYVKLFKSPTYRMADKDVKGKGGELHNKLKKDRVIKEKLKELGITDFKSLFKKMPSDLQKRVYNLKNFGQRADKHPEGNVLKHTIKVVNRSIKDDDIDIAIAAMFHDIGKDETAGIHPKKGHITHFGHEKVSASLVKKYRKFIESVGGNTANVFYIVKNHMKYKQLSDMRPKKADKVKSFRAFDKLGKFSKHDRGGLDEKIITEGGAYGHMSHPFDTDINLTFGQLKDIVNRALEGTLEFTREKTDGQALAISWRDGRLVAARNKGHLKNRGENALDIKGVSDKFQGRGGLSDAYNYAMKDLSNAISALSNKQRDKIFKQGACFMNLEVIYPTSVNVIPYGQALLVFHGTMEYDMDGKAIGENGEAARVLAGMIKQVNKDVQDNYTIQGPPIVKLPKSQDLSKKRSKYSSQISKLQKEFGLKDTDGVANYHQAWWEQWVSKNSPSSLDNKTKMGLVKRWAFMDKKFRLDSKNISDSKTLEWAKKTDKDNHKKISKDNLMKFEKIFLGLGAEVLEFTSSALTVNPDKAVRDIKKRIDKTIKDVKKSGDPKKIDKLKLELGRLNSIGGSKKIVPNEGIVFLYKGNTFKLTGTFASVNQILGIFF